MEETTVQSPLPEVIRELSSFSPERIAQVYEFVLFLKTRPEPVVNARDDWTEEDLRDVPRASLDYAEATLMDEDAVHDSTR